MTRDPSLNRLWGNLGADWESGWQATLGPVDNIASNLAGLQATWQLLSKKLVDSIDKSKAATASGLRTRCE